MPKAMELETDHGIDLNECVAVYDKGPRWYQENDWYRWPCGLMMSGRETRQTSPAAWEPMTDAHIRHHDPEHAAEYQWCITETVETGERWYKVTFSCNCEGGS